MKTLNASRWLKAGLVISLAIALTACVSTGGGPLEPYDAEADIAWSVREGNGLCKLVKLTESWVMLNDGSPIDFYYLFDLRTNEEFPSQLLTRLMGSTATDEYRYTDLRVILTITDPPAVRKANDIEPEDWVPLPRVEYGSPCFAASQRAESADPRNWAHTIRCHGKEFVRSGRSGFTASESPKARWLLLGSYNG